MNSNCTIREMVITDLNQVLAWRNHIDIRNYMLTQHIITPDEHRQWFEVNSRDPSRHLLIVEEGSLSLGFIHLKEATAPEVGVEWGFYIAPSSPKGSGSKLGVTALNYAFRTLQYHKINGRVIAINQPSIKFHLKLGFQQEGFLRSNLNSMGSTNT